MGDKVALLRVLYLPPERLRHRIVDLYLRAEHFPKAGLVESKRIGPFRVEDFDEEPGVVRRPRVQTAGRAIPRRFCCSHLSPVAGFSLDIMTPCGMLFKATVPDITAGCHPKRHEEVRF